jgi:hypothetical protein
VGAGATPAKREREAASSQSWRIAEVRERERDVYFHPQHKLLPRRRFDASRFLFLVCVCFTTFPLPFPTTRLYAETKFRRFCCCYVSFSLWCTAAAPAMLLCRFCPFPLIGIEGGMLFGVLFFFFFAVAHSLALALRKLLNCWRDKRSKEKYPLRYTLLHV